MGNIDLVERQKKCPWCFADDKWEVADWSSEAADVHTTHVIETLVCHNVVEYDNAPCEYRECGCRVVVEYDFSEEYVPEAER